VDRAVPGVARVVDDDVDLPELVDRPLDELVGDALLGQVAREDRGLTLDLLSGLLRDVAVEVVDQDLRALLAEQFGDRAADAASRAGDDGGLTVEYSHVAFSLVV